MSVTRVRSKTRAAVNSTFLSESTAVLRELQEQLTVVLRELGGVKKSGDLERMLGLDRTLAWQLVKVSESGDPLENAPQVPSRVSIERFVEGAHGVGVASEATTPLLEAHGAFETLVQRHAGDRVCFNSMISAAGKGNQWHAKELQHRRNVFRGMSHMLGVQAGLLLRSSIVRRMPENRDAVDSSVVGGVVDLRLLWEMERINVYQSRTFRKRDDGVSYQSDIARTNLRGQQDAEGYLLSSFCSPANPTVEMVHGDSGWIYGNLMHGSVGATAESTLLFGTRYYNIPHPEGREGQFSTRLHIELPVKSYVCDELIEPGFADDWLPRVETMVGSSSSDRAAPPGIERVLPSRLEFEPMGKGPKPLKEYKQYPELIESVAEQAGIDISQYECWRLRVDYPLYGSTISAELYDPRN